MSGQVEQVSEKVDIDFAKFSDEIARRAQNWTWEHKDDGDTFTVRYATHAPMIFDTQEPDLAQHLRAAHEGDWTVEPLTCLIIETLIDLFDVKSAIDIGTHLGFISLFMLRIPGVDRVDGVEMNPDVVRSVERTMGLNEATLSTASRFHMHNCALSDVDEPSQTIWYEGMRLAFEKRHRFTETTLDVKSLASLCEEMGDIPDLMKIDIEGYEAKLVNDLDRLLDRKRFKVILELHWDEIVERNGATRKDVVMPFLSRGYRAARLNWHQKMPRQNFMLEVNSENIDEMLANKNHAMYVFF